jgi:hypothetical protein
MQNIETKTDTRYWLQPSDIWYDTLFSLFSTCKSIKDHQPENRLKLLTDIEIYTDYCTYVQECVEGGLIPKSFDEWCEE